ncbi:MAG TPA: MaoC family dehydratase N-terminal domain-containing protein [Pseudonocardiaceae bacterium]|jgi:acyl dehydratase
MTDVAERPSPLTEEGIESIRARLGAYYGAGPHFIDITVDDIRRYADSNGDKNPLYRDAAYAAASRFGGIIAPNTFLDLSQHYTATAIGGLPGAHAFHAGNRVEFYLPVRPGDVISPTFRPYVMTEKAGKFAGRMVLVDMEILYRNQYDQLVGKAHGHVLRLSRAEARDRGKYREQRREPYTADALEEIADCYAAESVRGSTPRYWEDVRVGDRLGPIVRGPLRISEIAFRGWNGGGRLSGAGGRVLGAHYYQFAEYEKRPGYAEVEEKTGVADHPHRGHWEEDFARKIGVPGAYDIAVQRTAWLASLATNWAGDTGWLKKIWDQFRFFNVEGDTTWVEGSVAAKFVRDGEYQVLLDLQCRNQRGEVSAPGGALVVLPSKLQEQSS